MQLIRVPYTGLFSTTKLSSPSIDGSKVRISMAYRLFSNRVLGLSLGSEPPSSLTLLTSYFPWQIRPKAGLARLPRSAFLQQPKFFALVALLLTVAAFKFAIYRDAKKASELRLPYTQDLADALLQVLFPDPTEHTSQYRVARIIGARRRPRD